MKIQPLDLTVRDLVAGYHDDGEGGLVAYGGASSPKSSFVKATASV